MKLWNGSEFVDVETAKVWDGSEFVTPTAYVWDGSDYQLVYPLIDIPDAVGVDSTNSVERSFSSQSGASGVTITGYTHTPTGEPNFVLGFIVGYRTASQVMSFAMTYGGQSMMTFGPVVWGNNDSGSNSSFLQWFILFDPPTGAQTVAGTWTCSGSAAPTLTIGTIAFTGAWNIQGPVSDAGTETGTALALSVPSSASDLVVCCFSQENLGTGDSAPASFDASNGTDAILFSHVGGANADAVIGSATGHASLEFTATRTSGADYLESAVRVGPQPEPPFSETSTARTNQPVPLGVSGCYVTLIGGGGGGGGGASDAFGYRPGGGGGGGAALIERTWVPAEDLGDTYTVAVGAGGAGGPIRTAGSAGTASTFASGSVSMSAGGGGAGGGGLNSSTEGAGGSGGTASVSGVTATSHNGTAGGSGGPNGNAGSDAADNGSGGCAGGGGGGGRTSGLTRNAGGAGGDSTHASGGAGGPANSATPGGTPSSAGAGNPGAGGGGAGARSSGSGGPGAGGLYGGGGGGGSGDDNGTSGGNGASGYTLIEWVEL